MSEQRGPYLIEHPSLYSVLITSDVCFNAALSFDEYSEYPVPVSKSGNKYALTAMALTESMTLTLKAQGFDDIIVRNSIESIEEAKEEQ